MFTRLLVWYDDSAPAQITLAQAIAMGQRFRSSIVLVRVLAKEQRNVLTTSDTHPMAGPARPDPPEADVLDVIARAGLAGELIEARDGPVERVLDLAADSDVIMMSRGGSEVPWEDPLGEDTREVIRSSPIPVMVCGSSLSSFKRCAVDVDETVTSRRSVSLAARFAAITGTQLHLLSIEPAEVGGDDALAEAAAILSEPPVRFDIHYELGDRHSAIPAAVERLDCDALFVGGVLDDRRLSIPTHTEAMLRATDIPVLVHN